MILRSVPLIEYYRQSRDCHLVRDCNLGRVQAELAAAGKLTPEISRELGRHQDQARRVTALHVTSRTNEANALELKRRDDGEGAQSATGNHWQLWLPPTG